MITTISQFKQTINEKVMADKNYTHFAIHIATGQIMNAWNYKGYDKDDLNSDKGHYFLGDLKDQFPDEKINGKTVKIITRKSLDSAGIDPENIKNWYRPNGMNESFVNINNIKDDKNIYNLSTNELSAYGIPNTIYDFFITRKDNNRPNAKWADFKEFLLNNIGVRFATYAYSKRVYVYQILENMELLVGEFHLLKEY